VTEAKAGRRSSRIEGAHAGSAFLAGTTVIVVVIVIAVELLALATLRRCYFHIRFLYSFASITPGGDHHRHQRGTRSAG
jgi:hypothetical protein